MAQTKSRQKWQWAWVILPILMMGLLIAWAFLWQGQAAASATAGEAIHFNHQKHLSAGVPCLFCHPGTLNGAAAGIPSMEKCMGCHRSVQVQSKTGQASVQLLTQLYQAGEPLQWKKVNDLPDFVRFSHQPHVAAGVNCENCHGDIGSMTVTRQAYRINMGFCLHCHRQQPVEKQTRLQSCATCHY